MAPTATLCDTARTLGPSSAILSRIPPPPTPRLCVRLCVPAVGRCRLRGGGCRGMGEKGQANNVGTLGLRIGPTYHPHHPCDLTQAGFVFSAPLPQLPQCSDYKREADPELHVKWKMCTNSVTGKSASNSEKQNNKIKINKRKKSLFINFILIDKTLCRTG